MILTAVAGLSLSTAGPAAAATIEPGTWRPYGATNPPTSGTSIWNCTGELRITDDQLVTGRVCVIRTPNGEHFQGAVIIRNDRSSLYGTEVAFMMETYDDGDYDIRWVCPRSGVGAHSWSVCFGRTLWWPITFSTARVRESGANGVNLGPSPWG